MTAYVPTPEEKGYAQYRGFDSLSYNCIEHLMNNDETIWKLLYDLTPNAWNRGDLTMAQKRSMIYQGQDNSADYKVYLDQGAPDVMTREDCIIRISPHSIFPENRVIATVSMVFECYCNYKVNTLSNYKTRIDMITQRFLQVFNGVAIDGMVGNLYFDRMGSESNRLEWGGQVPWKGRWIIMSAKSN
jgi:hypothetical protein